MSSIHHPAENIVVAVAHGLSSIGKTSPVCGTPIRKHRNRFIGFHSKGKKFSERVKKLSPIIILNNRYFVFCYIDDKKYSCVVKHEKSFPCFQHIMQKASKANFPSVHSEVDHVELGHTFFVSIVGHPSIEHAKALIGLNIARPNKDDLGILEELFVDEIREFNEEYGINE